MVFTQLLPCTVGAGMFSSEVAVELKDNEKTVSLFVSKELVVHRNGRDFLRVTVVGPNGKPNYKTVLLPDEAFETGSRWLSVPEQILEAA